MQEFGIYLGLLPLLVCADEHISLAFIEVQIEWDKEMWFRYSSDLVRHWSILEKRPISFHITGLKNVFIYCKYFDFIPQWEVTGRTNKYSSIRGQQMATKTKKRER